MQNDQKVTHLLACAYSYLIRNSGFRSVINVHLTFVDSWGTYCRVNPDKLCKPPYLAVCVTVISLKACWVRSAGLCYVMCAGQVRQHEGLQRLKSWLSVNCGQSSLAHLSHAASNQMATSCGSLLDDLVFVRGVWNVWLAASSVRLIDFGCRLLIWLWLLCLHWVIYTLVWLYIMCHIDEEDVNEPSFLSWPINLYNNATVFVKIHFYVWTGFLQQFHKNRNCRNR